MGIPLLQSRTSPGPATLAHHNVVIGSLPAGGFTVKMTVHAFALIDSYVFGFALSENSLPINGPETVAEVAESMMLEFLAADYPNLLEFTTERPRARLRLRRRVRVRARPHPGRSHEVNCSKRQHRPLLTDPQWSVTAALHREICRY